MRPTIRPSYPPFIGRIGTGERADFHVGSLPFGNAVCSFKPGDIQSRSSRAHGVDRLDLQTVDHQSFGLHSFSTACPLILVRFRVHAWGAWGERQRKGEERAPGTGPFGWYRFRRAGRAWTLRTIGWHKSVRAFPPQPVRWCCGLPSILTLAPCVWCLSARKVKSDTVLPRFPRTKRL